ncbi:MAG: cupin domain-containing protein [Sedimentisphaerales bacterium]|jgi:predicted cupin superfamily sugar epimerase
MTAEQIIEFFKMKPLPDEGGWFVETYRAAEQIKKAALPAGLSGDRNISTAILYLLTANTVSLLHRLKSDEIFHFYLGNPVTMLQLYPDGRSEIITLGQDILNGQKVQVIIPKGAWQGAFIKDGGRFALMGCTVAPGFDYADYEQADRIQLVSKYPKHKEMITRLT